MSLIYHRLAKLLFRPVSSDPFCRSSSMNLEGKNLGTKRLGTGFSPWKGPGVLGLVLALLVLLPNSALAQWSIKSVKWGFAPAEGFRLNGSDPRVSEGLVRQGVSNPITIEWEGTAPEGELALELIQNDELGRQVRRKLPVTGPKVQGVIPTLNQPNPTLLVRLVQTQGNSDRVLTEIVVNPAIVPLGRPLGVCLGAVPEGLAQSLMPEDPTGDAAKKPTKPNAKGAAAAAAPIASLGVIKSLDDLPLEASAYESVDLLWIPMGEGSLGGQLSKAQPARLKALCEWLARGGRIVMAASPKTETLTQLNQAFTQAWGGPWIDAKPGAHEDLLEPRRLDRMYRWLDTRKPFEAMQVRKIQKWIPGPTALPIAVEPPAESNPETIVPMVESPSGNGAVLLCGFPFEGFPLSGWRGESAFYRRTLQWSGALRSEARVGETEAFNDPFSSGMAQVLGTFPGVVLFSFGWILVAILVYMLVIGPLDYWIVDRKLKRPELTWITFPILALGLSLLVPWLVGATKGDDLRINRMDLVEYDLVGPMPQVSGVSWLSLFTPTEGKRTVTAASSESWLGGAKPVNATVLPWSGSYTGPILLGGTGTAFVDLVNSSTEGLHPQGVPMRVNTDQAFQTQWRASLEQAQKPLVSSLRHPRANPIQLVGSITNRLPVAIESPILAYRGRFYPLESNLLSGDTIELDELKLGAGGQPLDFWTNPAVLAANKAEISNKPAVKSKEAREVIDRHQLVKNLFLGDRRQPGVLGGWNLRWRVFSSWEENTFGGRNVPTSFPRDEVVLFGRTPLVLGNAATDLSNGPTRFTLDGKTDPAGRILRETYIVAILPIAPYTPSTPTIGAKP